jgi:hypothetical protein
MENKSEHEVAQLLAIQLACPMIRSMVSRTEAASWVTQAFTLGSAHKEKEMSAEIARLRLALEKIEKLTIWNNQSLEQDFHDANEIASKALTPTQKVDGE